MLKAEQGSQELLVTHPDLIRSAAWDCVESMLDIVSCFLCVLL